MPRLGAVIERKSNMSKGLHVYSARCAWHGPIEKVGKLEMPPMELKNARGGNPIQIPSSGLPCCPYCKSVLFQIEEENWLKGVIQHNISHPGYAELVAWMEKQPRCYPTYKEAAFAFEKETGKTVKL